MSAEQAAIRDRRPTAASQSPWLVITLVLFVGGVGLAVLGVHRVFTLFFGDAVPMKIAATPASSAERRAGVVRGYATILGDGQAPLPPCLVSHKVGKNKKWMHLTGDATVRLISDGLELHLPGGTRVELFNDTFPNGGGITQAVYDRVHARLPHLREKGAWRISCVGPRDQVWIEGCTQGGQLGACAGVDKVVITPGDPALRVAWEKSRVMRWGAAALFGLLVALRLAAAAFGYPREVVLALARHEGRGAVEPSGAYWAVLAVFCLGLPITFSFAEWVFGPWVTGGAIVGLSLLFVIAMVMRVITLGRARRILVGTATTRLYDAEGARRELAVRVTDDAPTIEGFRPGARHAFVRFTIDEQVAETIGNKTRTSSQIVAQGSHPRYVPIQDTSGRGMLDLRHCVLDVLDEPDNQFQPEHVPPWLPQTLEQPIVRSSGHRGFTVTWKALDVGEPLLVFGPLERVMPGDVGATLEGREGYREPATVPIVRGSEGTRAIAYVGDERHLLTRITLERGGLACLLVVLPAAMAGLAALAVALLR